MPRARSVAKVPSLTGVRSVAAQIGSVLVRSMKGDEPAQIQDNLAPLLMSDRVAAALPDLATYHRVVPWALRALAGRPRSRQGYPSSCLNKNAVGCLSIFVRSPPWQSWQTHSTPLAYVGS